MDFLLEAGKISTDYYLQNHLIALFDFKTCTFKKYYCNDNAMWQLTLYDPVTKPKIAKPKTFSQKAHTNI